MLCDPARAKHQSFPWQDVAWCTLASSIPDTCATPVQSVLLVHNKQEALLRRKELGESDSARLLGKTVRWLTHLSPKIFKGEDPLDEKSIG